ncbi:MAG: protein kinase [Gemmatimonadales bacterium]
MTATAVPPVDRLKSVLGDAYAIDRELGRGGMATVYLAQDVKHDRLVALKVLHSEVAESLGADRFLREIRTAARLNHPHILPLFDSGNADGFLYYVMPYVEGESLRQLLDRLGHLDVEDAIDYTKEMAAALDYSHRRGVVHRDIKPENVMLHEGIAMLMDFGIAKALDTGADGQLTATGMFVGTPAYVSPEQAFGESNIDGRSDQFSLACMLHEMITGEQLFTGSSPQAVIAKRMSTSAPQLNALDGRVSTEVKEGLTRAMSLEPEQRFSTMREFASCLLGGGRSTPQSLRFVDAPAIAASKSIAVLPFSNMSADPENEYLADGIAEEIINALSKVRTLRVASRALSFAMKGKTGDLGDIGRKLKVSTVLAGTVRKSGNRIRVSAELINAADGAQLWAERYDRQMEDVFEIQDDISEAIVRALRVILGDAERKALKAKTRDVRAYEYYLRGQQFVGLRRKSVDYAIEMFDRAIAIDPDYAEAHAGRSHALSLMFLLFDPNDDILPLAVESGAKAVELDPDLAEAWFARGMAYSIAADNPNADIAMAKALSLNPRLYDVPYYWGRALMWQGRHEEALRLFQMAQSIRPEDYTALNMLTMVYESLGRTHEAEASRKRQMKLMQDRLALNPDDARAWVLSAGEHAKMGDREKTEEAVRRALAIDPDDSLTDYNAACAYALLGESEKAMDHLAGAMAKGWQNREWIANDPDFAFMRDLPRYRELIGRMRSVLVPPTS